MLVREYDLSNHSGPLSGTSKSDDNTSIEILQQNWKVGAFAHVTNICLLEKKHLVSERPFDIEI